jgi:hypothetical protein
MMRFAMACAAFLALGFATTVGVAWGIAIRTDPRGVPRLHLETGTAMSGYYSPAHNAVWRFVTRAEVGMFEITGVTLGTAPDWGPTEAVPAERQVDESAVPAWSFIASRAPQAVEPVYSVERATGWPLPAGVMRLTSDLHTGKRLGADSLRLPRDLQRFGPGIHLPVRVLWRGALLDSVFFAWAWFAVLSFPVIIRRAWRRRRGTCPTCAYDLRGSFEGVCPECGSPTRAARR